MALRYAPRVKETTATTGTGAYSLGGAASGFQSFGVGIGDGNTTLYCCEGGGDWEIGVGEFADASPDTLSRESILASSNEGSEVDWAAGGKSIYCIFPYPLLDALGGGQSGIFGHLSNSNVNGIGLIKIGNLLLFSGSNTDSEQHTLRNHIAITTDATPTGVDSSGLTPFFAGDATIALVVDVVARQTDGTSGTVGDSKWIRLEFLIQYTTAPTLTLVGSVTTTVLAASAGAAAWTATVDVAETNSIQVTGEADKDIRWMVSIKGIELGHPS